MLFRSVPADARLLESNNLLLNESSLTGESRLVEKQTDKMFKKGDITSPNMIYQGTTVAEGKGLCVITATGYETKFGKIALFADESEDETPLQKKMKILSREIGIKIGRAHV